MVHKIDYLLPDKLAYYTYNIDRPLILTELRCHYHVILIAFTISVLNRRIIGPVEADKGDDGSKYYVGRCIYMNILFYHLIINRYFSIMSRKTNLQPVEYEMKEMPKSSYSDNKPRTSSLVAAEFSRLKHIQHNTVVA